MDTLWSREQPSSDYNTEYTQPDDEISRNTNSIFDGGKKNSVIETPLASVYQNQIQEPSSNCALLSVNEYDVELNQLVLNQPCRELNGDVGIELVPICKQHATTKLQTNLDTCISYTTVPILTDVIKTNRTGNRPTLLLPYEPLNPNTMEPDQPNPYQPLDTDIWKQIFPEGKPPASAESCSDRDISHQRVATDAATDRGAIDDDEPLYTAVIGRQDIIRQEDVSMLDLAVEELYATIDDANVNDDQLLIPERGQYYSARPLPEIPKQGVSRQICVRIGVFVLALSVLFLIVFLAVYIPRGVLTKQINDTIGTQSFSITLFFY